MKFGDRVNVTKKMERVTRYRCDDRGFIGYSHAWEEVGLKGKEEGIYLGERYLFDGVSERDSDGLSSFMQEKKIKVALVCVSERKNPFYVPIENIEAVNG